MTYKNYRIKNKFTYPNYIKFELNGLVEFSNGNHNFIFCLNKLPFKNYQIGDEIEVNLTDAKHMSSQSYHQEVIKKTSSGWRPYEDYIPQAEESERLSLLQVQEQATLLVSAYDKQLTHKLFRSSLEWVEKYIEVVYPSYKIKKQIHDNNIKRSDINDPSRVKRLLSSKLFGFKMTMEVIKGDKYSKQSLFDEVKQEYYKWLGSIGIEFDSCPSELKHFLFEINEILEGRGDKLEREVENRKWEIDPNSAEYEASFSKLFSNIQNPLENERNKYEDLKGKTQKDIKISNNFSGDGEKVEKIFKQMSGKHDYRGFVFMNQKDNLTVAQEKSSSGFQQRPNSTIIRNVEQNPNHWRFDEVIIDEETKMALVHHSVLDEVVDLDSQPVYLPQKFSAEEMERISKVLNVSVSQPIRQELVGNIKQNAKLEKGLWVLNRETNEVSEGEDWFIHNQLKREFDKKTGYLIYVPNAMIRAKDLSEGEQKAVGYKAEQTSQQVQTVQSGGSGLWSGKYNVYIAGSTAILSLIGLAFVR